MTDNEKLIEETAKAIMEASHGDGEWEFREPIEEELYLRRARAALAVFEKAHTPTDDEREALRIAHLDARQAAYRKEREDWFVDHEAEPEIASNAFFRGWDAAVGGGFRRSEVPGGEEWQVAIEAERERQIAKGYTAEHDARHGIRHLLSWAMDYDRRGKTLEASALKRAALDLLPREPQGEPSDRIPWETAEGVVTAVDLDGTVRRAHPEPSDAQVVAALNAFWPDSAAPSIHLWTKDGFADDMRRALRAAGGVR